MVRVELSSDSLRNRTRDGWRGGMMVKGLPGDMGSSLRSVSSSSSSSTPPIVNLHANTNVNKFKR